MEHYKIISDISELQWYFDHVIAKPKNNEAYAFCMASRHKKLTKEEREELGQSSDDGMLDPQVVFPGHNGEWDFLRWAKGIMKYEVPKLAYTTRKNKPFLEKTLVLYSTPNPSDERNVIQELKSYIAIHERELIDSALKGSKDGVDKSLYKLCHSLVKFKRLQFDHTGSRNWVDFDLDLNDEGKKRRDEIYKAVHAAFLSKFGRNSFAAVQTTGGYHFLVMKSKLNFNPNQFCKDILESHGYTEFADEFKYNNNGMLPTPGTYQYGTPVVVVNKEDFDN